jgi:inosine-uridine nucleoside N-ribohydrolase
VTVTRRIALSIAILVATVDLAEARPERIKVLIDADPGIDDAMAILFALRSDAFDVVGLTTVFGNAHLEATTANALRLVELSGRDVPVARGAARPLSIPLRPPPDFVHGADGLGNIDAPPPSREPVAESAARFIVDTARRHPNRVTLLAVGRMTNLARALALEPRLPELVREVVVMGGAVSVPGNVSPVTEANIGGDPHAADIVLTAGWPITMVGLDVTTVVRLTDERIQRIARDDELIGGFIRKISRFYRQFYESIGLSGGFYVHDPSAVAFVLDRSLFTTKKAPVRVAREGIATGQTVAAFERASEWEPWRGRPEVDVCVGVDAKGLLELFETTLTR